MQSSLPSLIVQLFAVCCVLINPFLVAFPLNLPSTAFNSSRSHALEPYKLVRRSRSPDDKNQEKGYTDQVLQNWIGLVTAAGVYLLLSLFAYIISLLIALRKDSKAKEEKGKKWKTKKTTLKQGKKSHRDSSDKEQKGKGSAQTTQTTTTTQTSSESTRTAKSTTEREEASKEKGAPIKSSRTVGSYFEDDLTQELSCSIRQSEKVDTARHKPSRKSSGKKSVGSKPSKSSSSALFGGPSSSSSSVPTTSSSTLSASSFNNSSLHSEISSKPPSGSAKSPFSSAPPSGNDRSASSAVG